MKINLDLTGVDFVDSEIVDFYDSKTIFFEPTNYLPETVRFKIWGADIHRNFEWGEYIAISKYPNIQKVLSDKEGHFTIKGFSEITFKKVIAGKILITPYHKGESVKLKNGDNLTFTREWNLDRAKSDCFQYWLDTNIFFPYGACDLKLYTKGSVTFEFDPADCVSSLQYITDKKRNETFWGYLKNKELTTNSLIYERVDPEK